MMDNSRRRFLLGTLASALGGVLLYLPRLAVAAWPIEAFRERNSHGALRALFGDGETVEAGDKIQLSVTDLAENGAVVPVTIESSLPQVEAILILVEKNPSALVAHFKLGSNVNPFIKANIKMAQTSHVTAVVVAGGRRYSTRKKVRVILNGCGN